MNSVQQERPKKDTKKDFLTAHFRAMDNSKVYPRVAEGTIGMYPQRLVASVPFSLPVLSSSGTRP